MEKNILIIDDKNIDKIKQFFSLFRYKTNFIKIKDYINSKNHVKIDLVFLEDLNLSKESVFKDIKFLNSTFSKSKTPIISVNETAFYLASNSGLSTFGINNHSNTCHEILFNESFVSMNLLLTLNKIYLDNKDAKFIIPSNHNKFIYSYDKNRIEVIAYSKYFLSDNYNYHFGELFTRKEVEEMQLLESEIIYDKNRNNLFFSFDILNNQILNNESLHQLLIKIIEEKI